MQRIGKIVIIVLLWAIVGGYIFYFHSRAHHHRTTTLVHSVEVNILDSLRDAMLVTSDAVMKWIERSGVPTLGVPIAEVDLAAIEHNIRQNGFIERASAYVTYTGELQVEVSQRQPLMRLMVDGYDCYITEQGHIFPAPRSASAYVPVVTGSYIPPVPADYMGSVKEYIDGMVASSQAYADTLQYEKVPLFEFSEKLSDSVRSVRRMQVERKGWLGGFKGPFEDYDEFDARVEAKREEKAQLRRALRYLERENNKRIDAVSRRQQAEVEKQKKLLKRYEDFLKLINFVKYIEEDSFWRAEIVQIVASTMSSGDLRIDLIPRTGNHRVRFGRVENVEAKLDKLLAFYQNGLSNIGWDSFRTISVEYHGQVVCTKN
jgi:hypothetical protein